MKTKAFLACAAVALALAGSGGAGNAAVVYSNGPIDGTISGYTINFGYAVANTFTLAAPATITGVDFGVWNFSGDVISFVDWSITETPYVYPAGVTTAVTSTFQYKNGYGYDIYEDNFSLDLYLPAGTYWLVLQNAVVARDNAAYWDVNDGPSYATNSDLGDVDSESFNVTANAPELSTWAMMGLGFAGLALAGFRARRSATGRTFGPSISTARRR